jgi:alginate O-acetyltransferase complex protein AlgJ
MSARETTPVMRDALIGRGTAIAMSVIFVAAILFPALHQLRSDLKQGGRWSVLSLFRRIPTRESLKEFEEALARDSELGSSARRGYQTALTRILGQGNDRVLVGRDGFLFFRKEVDMVTGEGFLSRRPAAPRGRSDRGGEKASVGPVAAIVDTGRQLRARGIPLLFIPIPAKPSLYPERVWPTYPAEAGPAWNRDRGRFLSALSGSGVDVLDVTDDLWRAKAEGEVFLRQDTHWSPLGLRVAADRIAGRLRTIAGVSGLAGASRTVPVTNGGDLLRMLDLLPERSPFALQTVEVVRPMGRPAGESPLLLLGDSFTNIYRRKELEWGEGAGLAEQLELRLGVPVQVLALNGGGASAVRQLLAQKPELLRGKRAVVWACSARDLFDEAVSWETVALPEP